MATKYLDYTGLSYFWGKIKSYIASLLSSKADDSDVVHIAGTETVTGNKTFSGDVTLNQNVLKATVKDTGSTTTRTDTVFQANSSNSNYGINTLFGSSSSTIIGAGEGKNSQLSEIAGSGSENVYIVADGNIVFKPNANTYANAKVATFNATGDLIFSVSEATRGTAPSSTISRCTSDVKDSAGNRIGIIGTEYHTNKSSLTAFWAYNTTIASGSNIGYLGIGCDSSGNVYTVSPTPLSTTDDSTKIATTAWVRDATGNFACNAATATKATQDASGNVITDTYETKANAITALSASGTTLTYTKGDGTTGTITTQDTNTDTLVTQNVSTTDSTYPLLLCPTANATTNQGAKTAVFAKSVKINPSTNELTASTFISNSSSPGLTIKSSTADRSTSLSTSDSDLNFGEIYIKDRNDDLTGYFESTKLKDDNSVRLKLSTYNDSSNNEAIGIELRTTTAGKDILYVPSPELSTDSSRKAATTEWVRGATGNFACNAATATLASDSTVAQGVYFIVPNEISRTATLTATVSGITELRDGLMIALRMPFNTAASSTLNINSLGAKPIYYKVDTVSANYYPANTLVLLVYETTTLSTGCFKMVYSYDSDTNNATAQNISTSSNTFPVLIGYTANATANIGNKATYFCKDVKIQPSTGILSANGFAGNVTGNASTASALATSRTISLTGDVTGSASFDGSANASITVTVADDSHNHVISNVDGLQDALDAKAADSGVVHLAGSETVSGVKIFAANLALDTSEGSKQIYGLPTSSNTYPSFVRFGAASAIANGSCVVFYGKDNSSYPGGFRLYASTGDSSARTELIGTYDGTLTWGGNAIQTASDERLKTPLSSVPDEVLDAWEAVGWGQFQFLDAVERKGEAARLHLGLIAQRVKAVFEERGLDACAYGILCHEEHEATEEEPVVDLWMVRYEEALAMEAVFQRRRAEKAEVRIKALEDRLEALEVKFS